MIYGKIKIQPWRFGCSLTNTKGKGKRLGAGEKIFQKKRLSLRQPFP
jgi:hypothetical protein